MLLTHRVGVVHARLASMRFGIDTFAGGVLAGLALACVAVLLVEAGRRTRQRRLAESDAPRHIIDGVHPPHEAELDARPAEEANAQPHHLVSEAADVVGDNERW